MSEIMKYGQTVALTEWRDPEAHLAEAQQAAAALGRVIAMKPKPVIFELALQRLGVDAGEALFVGDRADIDVAGAQGVGMPVAWINRDSSPLPEDVRAPEFEIRDLAELERILSI